MEKLFSVSEVARNLGRSVDWLREAERKSKIPKAKRDLNNRRVYPRRILRSFDSRLCQDW